VVYWWRLPRGGEPMECVDLGTLCVDAFESVGLRLTIPSPAGRRWEEAVGTRIASLNVGVLTTLFMRPAAVALARPAPSVGARGDWPCCPFRRSPLGGYVGSRCTALIVGLVAVALSRPAPDEGADAAAGRVVRLSGGDRMGPFGLQQLPRTRLRGTVELSRTYPVESAAPPERGVYCWVDPPVGAIVPARYRKRWSTHRPRARARTSPRRRGRMPVRR